MDNMLLCKHCGASFQKKENSKGITYCSKKCFYESMRKYTTLICDQCGKEFCRRSRKTRKRKHFCSQQCSHISQSALFRITTPKVCSKCGIKKDNTSFEQGKKVCEECRALARKNRPVSQESKDKKKEYAKLHLQRHREICRDYDLRNKEKIAEKHKVKNLERKGNGYYERYYNKNKERIIKRVSEYKNNLSPQSISFMAHKLRHTIRETLRRAHHKKIVGTSVMLGASYEAVLSHLTGNGAIDPAGLQIDHVVPCAQAKNREELIKLQNYRNLQLLTKEENIRKSANRNQKGEELCLTLLGREWEDG